MTPRNHEQHMAQADKKSKQSTRAEQGVSQYRTNAQWIAGLKGDNGIPAQQLAHMDLSNYLYVVVFNYLQGRRTSLAALSSYSDDELIPVAQDFVQNFMEKLVKKNYDLLRKYSNTGRFTSWAAQVVINLCSTEFRRAHWSRQELMNQQPYWDRRTLIPENSVVRNQVTDTLVTCLEKLPEHYREALVRCVGEGERASKVAEDLDVSPNAVYILIHRAKSAMREHLAHEGIGPNTLGVFKDMG